MKGTLHKCKVDGWLVLYTVEETWDKCIPIHPDYEKYYFLDDDADGKEVEFEIVTYNKNGSSYNNLPYHTYAKLINQVPDVRKMVEDDVEKFALKYIDDEWSDADDTVRFGIEVGIKIGYKKAKEHYELAASVRELKEYKLGFNCGYKQAKETLYTEEQVWEAMHKVRDSRYATISDDEIIQSLKQPKKD
jgi:hypothetical protein